MFAMCLCFPGNSKFCLPGDGGKLALSACISISVVPCVFACVLECVPLSFTISLLSPSPLVSLVSITSHMIWRTIRQLAAWPCSLVLPNTGVPEGKTSLADSSGPL